MNGRSQQVPPGLGHGLLSAVVPALKRWLRLLPLLLALTLAGVSLPLPAAALSPPWRRSPQADIQTLSSGRVMPPLQEVSPPEAVQQIQAALATRQPVVEIVSPAPDSLLPPGSWTLRLRVRDWPLVEGGPHLVVQLDQEPPQIWTSPEGVLPELSPGSHRLTVYAALPWGEARKNPGSMQQIRLHRSAANPLALPAPGSPQLLAVSPAGPAAQEPLMLDWLLLDAPLQDVGGSGTQWRLRVTINGDAVLLDQQSPLWLRGWQPGLNALSLELLDGRGEPLNPPFNSLVQEVDLSDRAGVPRWQGGLLSEAELAILLGESTPSRPPAAAPGLKAVPPAVQRPETRTGRDSLPAQAAAGDSASEPRETSPARGDSGADIRASAEAAASVREPPPQVSPQPQAAPQVESSQQTKPQPAAADTRQTGTQAAQVAPTTSSAAERIEASPQPGAGQSAADSRPAADQTPAQTQPLTPAQSSEQTAPQARPSQPGADSGRAAEPAGGRPAASEPDQPDASAVAAELATAGVSASATAPAGPSPSPDPPEPTMTAAAPAPSTAPQAARSPDELSSTPPQPQPGSPRSGSDQSERVRTSSELGGRARDLVNDDGTLRRPERRGPLAGLRERLQR